MIYFKQDSVVHREYALKTNLLARQSIKIQEKAGSQEGGRATDWVTWRPLCKRFPLVWKWPPVLSMCSRVWSVQDGGGGKVMSQAHMLASVPDLLVSPVRHLAQQGAARAPVCCVTQQEDEKCWKCRSHNVDVRWICGSHYTHYIAPTQHTHCVLCSVCLCMWDSNGVFVGWGKGFTNAAI